MVVHTSLNLAQALRTIKCTDEYRQFPMDELKANGPFLETYGKAKWAIVDIINQKYSSVLKDKVDLYNWLYYNENDEVAYFLNEAGSNSLNHSEHKAPHQFHLWLGAKGFIIGIEQKGKGFNVERITAGGGFTFFEKCKSTIFFDDVHKTNIIFMQFLLDHV